MHGAKREGEVRVGSVERTVHNDRTPTHCDRIYSSLASRMSPKKDGKDGTFLVQEDHPTKHLPLRKGREVSCLEAGRGGVGGEVLGERGDFVRCWRDW